MEPKKKKRKKSLLPWLRSLGFDESYKTSQGYRVACSQCRAMTINGTPVHERGCPNEVKEEE